VNILINPLNAEINPMCHLLALLGAHHILHVSRIRVKESGEPTRACAPAWGLDEVLTILHRKNFSCYKTDTCAFLGVNCSSDTT
jgi:hypothetical protein